MTFIVSYNVVEALFIFMELRIRSLILSLVIFTNIEERVVHS
jgi:hypothetical protein